MPSTRTFIARLALTAAPLLAASALAGPAQAQEMLPPAPVPAPAPSTLQPVSVPAAAIAEGTSDRLAIPLTCKKGKGNCTFRVGTINGTAVSATDFAARGFVLVLRPGQSKTVGFTVKGLVDDVCETAEAFTVQVQSQRGKAGRVDSAQVQINRDADINPICARQADADARQKADAGIE